MRHKKLLTAITSLVSLVFLLISCASQMRKPVQYPGYRFFPSPPAIAKIQFLTSIGSSADVVGQPSFFKRYIFGDEPDRPINKPYGITVKKGKIYLCDTMLPGLEIIDLSLATFEYFIPGGPGALKKPTNCDVDESGRLFVADTERKQVIIFDANLSYYSVIGDGQNMKPTDVAVHQNKIWVCDLQNHQIKVFSSEGLNPLFAFPNLNSNRPEYLFSPTNIDIANDRIYVTDTGDSKVKIFDLAGEYVASIGNFGKSSGEFVRPKGVAADQEGNVFIVDAAFENVQVFNPGGNLLSFFGGSYKEKGDMYLPANVFIDYDHTGYYEKYVAPDYSLKYLIFITNQYGPDKIGIYGFLKPKTGAG